MSYCEGEMTYFFKLYLHILYEIEQFLNLMQNLIGIHCNEILDILSKTSDKDKKWKTLFDKIDMEE